MKGKDLSYETKRNDHELVFLIAACCSVLAVALICIFLFMNGVPAILKSDR